MINLGTLAPPAPGKSLDASLRAALYAQVRTAQHELRTFADIVVTGQVRPAPVALWAGRNEISYLDPSDAFAAGRRDLYVAIRHQQMPVDLVSDGPALKQTLAPYRVLYLTEQKVSRPASEAIAAWVAGGGRLFATAGAGMLDEAGQPNAVLRRLFGVEQQVLETRPHNAAPDATIVWEKRDLPWAQPIDTIAWIAATPQPPMPVIAVRSLFGVTAGDARLVGRYSDNSPAVVMRSEGKGIATYCGFLPGLAYLKPGLPQQPVDRGNSPQSMAHLLPTEFDLGAAGLIAGPLVDVERPVRTTHPLVESNRVDAPGGTLITLVNWSGTPIKDLGVRVVDDLAGRTAKLASGRAIKTETLEGQRVYRIDLDEADALVLR